MKIHILIMTCLLLCISLMLVSCDKLNSDLNAVTKFFQNRKIGTSPDFIIQKKSVIDPTQWDHAIVVYGFGDDGGVAKELVDYFNERYSKGEYRAIQINH